MTASSEDMESVLPDFVRLRDVMPGEPPFMRKRKKPAVLRFHRENVQKNPKKYLFSECLKYIPFRDESEIHKLLENCTENDLNTLNSKISSVKMKVMEHLDSVEEARLMVDEILNSKKIGEILNPEIEQEISDCVTEDIQMHPDFTHLNPDDLPKLCEKHERIYKPIEIDEKGILLEKTRKLDFFQRKVVERGISYCRDLIKSRKGKNKLPNAPRIIIIGGAGSGARIGGRS